jgi:hypothetical protein
MKVYELMEILADCAAGADVHVFHDEEDESYTVVDVTKTNSKGGIVYLDHFYDFEKNRRKSREVKS